MAKHKRITISPGVNGKEGGQNPPSLNSNSTCWYYLFALPRYIMKPIMARMMMPTTISEISPASRPPDEGDDVVVAGEVVVVAVVDVVVVAVVVAGVVLVVVGAGPNLMSVPPVPAA
jgi:hypothetical protein